ncbi:hypothetical protein [Xanthocytophaga flava]|uniref:hypothetical protein n=1 Tax=Xanthocytophaga flava TaxID=3048013 RepID=UPI0028D8E5C0|nr:hypothetical protein [Xanthocytophaga flavus]MDJ1471903.1 hypothetical protein [Xanthocytophaga flavus]
MRYPLNGFVINRNLQSIISDIEIPLECKFSTPEEITYDSFLKSAKRPNTIDIFFAGRLTFFLADENLIDGLRFHTLAGTLEEGIRFKISKDNHSFWGSNNGTVTGEFHMDCTTGEVQSTNSYLTTEAGKDPVWDILAQFIKDKSGQVLADFPNDAKAYRYKVSPKNMDEFMEDRYKNEEINYMDTNTVATNSKPFTLSDRKFRYLFPEYYKPVRKGVLSRIFGNSSEEYVYDVECAKNNFNGADHRKYISEVIQFGTIHGAVVIEVNPLRIAAYNSDLDCVVMLEFPAHFVTTYKLQKNQKLITANSFGNADKVQGDLIPGKGNGGYWQRVHPCIVDFLTDDLELLKNVKNSIEDDEWRYIYRLGLYMHRQFNSVHRDGRPGFSSGTKYEIVKMPPMSIEEWLQKCEEASRKNNGG